jgi:hypothetical protein
LCLSEALSQPWHLVGSRCQQEAIDLVIRSGLADSDSRLRDWTSDLDLLASGDDAMAALASRPPT